MTATKPSKQGRPKYRAKWGETE